MHRTVISCCETFLNSRDNLFLFVTGYVLSRSRVECDNYKRCFSLRQKLCDSKTLFLIFYNNQQNRMGSCLQITCY